MRLSEWLISSMQKLRQAGVDSPRRDCMVLIEDLLGKDRSWVNAHGEHKLSTPQVKTLDQQISQRISRKPLAYIRGKAWFYGRFFEANPHILIPRPESESFIEILRELDLKSPTIADIGTGSGCLGITAALEIPESKVDLYDIDEHALEVARRNVTQHKLSLPCLQSDLLDQLDKKSYDILLANLPYVPEGLVTSPEIKTEPEAALFSGKDGLSHYRRFWAQVGRLEQKPKYVLTESLENQREKLEKLAVEAGYDLADTQVLVQLFSLK